MRQQVIAARVRKQVISTALAARAVMPRRLSSALGNTVVGRRIRGLLRGNISQSSPAYDAAEIQTALRALSPPCPVLGAETEAIHRLGDELGARAAAGVFDASGVSDQEFVNLVNMLHAKGVRRTPIIPPAGLLARAKQSFVPFVNEGPNRTRILVHNYFGKNYAIDDAVLVVVLVDAGGGLMHGASRLLVPDESVELRGEDMKLGEDVGFGRHGVAACLAIHPAMTRVATEEFRVVVSLDTPTGCGAVHSMPARRFSVPQEVANGSKGYVTAATRSVHVVKAAHDPGAELVRNGELVTAVRGAEVIEARRASPDPAWAAVDFRFAAKSRSAVSFYVGRDGGGGLSLHHDQGPHVSRPAILTPTPEFLARRHIVSNCAPLFHFKDVDVSLVLDARNMENRYAAMRVAICDDAGVVRRESVIPTRNPLVVVDLGPLRREAGLPKDACGYLQLTDCVEGAELHTLLDGAIVVGYYRHGERLLDNMDTNPTQTADYFPVPGMPPKQQKLGYRAKKFAPFTIGPAWKGFLWTANTSFTRETRPGQITLTLRREGSTESRRYTIAPREARLWDIEAEFGLDPSEETTAAVWLESRDANFFAYYIFEDRNDPLRFTIDHMTGG